MGVVTIVAITIITTMILAKDDSYLAVGDPESQARLAAVVAARQRHGLVQQVHAHLPRSQSPPR
jgi:hypothetical protein